jgi:Zn-dependent protease with chaperone function
MSYPPEDAAAADDSVEASYQGHESGSPAEAARWEVPHVSIPPVAPPHTAPGSFWSDRPMPVPPRERGFRRHVDAATVATLITSLPWIGGSFFAVVLVLMALDALLPIGALVTPITVAWLLSGAIIFLPGAEPHIAHVVLGLRKPAEAEEALINTAWTDVAQRASLDSASYSIWIDDRDTLTACVPGGNILAVPRKAIEIPARQRAAVIAHELGHHLAGHAWARMLVQWYSAPARWTVRVYRTVLRATGRGGQVAGPVGATIGCFIGIVWLLIGLAIVVGIYSQPWLRVAIPVFLVLPWLSRWAEKRCDRVAADLGFGPDLMDLFRYWQESGRDEGSASGLIGRIFASRPTVGARMHALQAYLTERGLR